MKDVILVGGFIETIELCELCGYNILGIVDDKICGEIKGYPILGTDDNAPAIYKKHPSVPIIIAPDKPLLRKKLVCLYQSVGFEFANLISPKANISPSAIIGEGVVIQSLCNISANTVLKDFVRINTCANIMHDCIIGNFVTIAPNAVALGYVRIGDLSYIGSNAVIIEKNVIGMNAMIGAGAVVNKDIPDNCVAVGVPAKIIKRLK